MAVIRRARLCGQWDVDILAPTEETGDFEGRSYMHWLATDAKNVSLHTTAAYVVYSRLLQMKTVQRGFTVLEYFGGAGLHSKLISELLNPSRHVIVERNQVAFAQLLHSMCGKAHGVCSTFEDYKDERLYEIVHVDHPRFSISRFRQHYKEFNHIFRQNKPRVFILTDTARNKFHLNKQPFSRAVGRNIETFDDYLQGTSALFEKEFGFSVKLCAVTRFSCMMAMTNRSPSEIEMLDVLQADQEVKGFEWVSGYLTV